jgi:hypothetical protein
MRSSLAETSAFMKPGCGPIACMRSTSPIASVAMRAVTPWRWASPSRSPTWASGGSVNTQYGINRSRVLRLPPARFSVMIRKSSADACVTCGLPADSPIAQTSGALVSRRSLTRM